MANTPTRTGSAALAAATVKVSPRAINLSVWHMVRPLTFRAPHFRGPRDLGVIEHLVENQCANAHDLVSGLQHRVDDNVIILLLCDRDRHTSEPRRRAWQLQISVEVAGVHDQGRPGNHGATRIRRNVQGPAHQHV